MIKGLNNLKIFAIVIIFFIVFINPASSQTAGEWVDKGVAYYDLGEYKKAIEAYDRAIAIDPGYKEAWSYKGIAFGDLGEYKKAIEAYDRAIIIDPNDKEVWFLKGVAFVYLGEYKKAIEASDRAIVIDPDYKEAWYGKGVAFEYLGEYKKAIEAYDRAIAIDPYFEEAKINRGLAISKMVEQATTPASSQTTEEWFDRGLAFSYSGEFKKAIEAYDGAIAIDQKFKEAWYNKGLAFGYLGEYKKAVEAFDRTIAIDQKFKEAWYNKGLALTYLGEYKKAIEAYDRAIAIDPDYQDAWYNKGIVFGDLGDYTKAIEAFDKAITIDPNDKQAKRGRELAVKKMAEQSTAAPPSSNQENNWVLIGVFLNFAVNLIIWFFIIVMVAFIVAWLRKAESYRPYVLKAFWVALVIGALATIPSLLNTFQNSTPTHENLGITDDIDSLSSAEKIRFKEILTGVMQDPDYLTPNVHAEFWALIDKVGPRSPSETQELRDMMTGVVTIYQRYFYEDALWALKTGRPFKSSQRERYEKHLLNLGTMTEWRIKENEALIAKIAAREPIPYQGTTIVFNEDIINEILANLEVVGKRLDTLFTKPEVRDR